MGWLSILAILDNRALSLGEAVCCDPESRALVPIALGRPELKAQLVEVAKGFREEQRQAIENE